jgi:hypothetical protein
MPVVDAHRHFLRPAIVTILRSDKLPYARAHEREESGTWIVCESGLEFRLTRPVNELSAGLSTGATAGVA